MIKFLRETKMIVLSVAIFILCLIIGYVADRKMNPKEKKVSKNVKVKSKEKIKEEKKENSPVFDETIKEDNNVNNMF